MNNFEILTTLFNGHIAIALGCEGDRQWVKDFDASDKSQVVYELNQWLNGLGLQLIVTVKSS